IELAVVVAVMKGEKPPCAGRDNRKLDFKWYGPPSEAYGASNNPPPRMGAARWDDIVFTVDEAGATISVRLIGGKQ
ncbi:MAG: DUF2141 domain-containing protein, partial [Pseudomonadota bacterium]